MTSTPPGRGWLRAGSAVATARLFSLGAAAIQLPLLTAWLAPAEYAVVAVAISVATYFSLVAAETTILGFERFPGDSSDDPNYRYAIVRVLLGLGGATALAVVAGLLAGQPLFALAVAGWGVGISLNRLIAIAWLMWGEPWRYAANLMASTGVRTAVLVGTVLVGVDPMLALASAGAASGLVALVISPLRAARWDRATQARPWTLSIGVNLAIAAGSVTALSNANLLLLTPFASSDALGSYAVMLQFATLTAGALLNLGLTVVWPRLRASWDAGGHVEARRRIDELQFAALAIGLAVVVLAYAGDGLLLRIVFPDNYVDLRVLAPLILGVAVTTAGTIASWMHQLAVETRRVARRTAIAAAFGVLVTALLAFTLAELGAALGSMLGATAYVLIMRVGARSGGWTDPAIVGVVLAGATSLLPIATAPLIVLSTGTLLLVTLGIREVVRRRLGRRLG